MTDLVELRGHTPGPWIAPPYSSVVGLGVVGVRGTVICTIATPPGSNPNTAESKHEIAAWDEIRANARLIAKAPELLDRIETLEAEITRLRKGLQSIVERTPFEAKFIRYIAEATLERELGNQPRVGMCEPKE